MESMVPWQPEFEEMLISISCDIFYIHVLFFLQHSDPFNSLNYVLIGYGGFLGSWSKKEFQDNPTEDGNHAVNATKQRCFSEVVCVKGLLKERVLTREHND